MKAFWEEQHKMEHIPHLSGCGYQETIDFLQIQPYIQPGISVLEVGVGMGLVTKGLYQQNFDVHALDISRKGLKRVSKFCNKIYLVSELDQLPKDYFDLIICHNVAQHVETPLLMIELNTFIQSLKPTGLLALEFVSYQDVKDTWTKEYVFQGILPRFSRSPRFMKKAVQIFNGQAEHVVNNICNFKNVTGCHVFHIRKI